VAVLILSPVTDEHAVAVSNEIRRLGSRAETVDLSDFPQRARLSARYACCTNDGGRDFVLELARARLDLADFGAIWWRRPQHPEVSPDLVRPAHQQFAINESHEALRGLWPSLDAFWINDPARDEVAARKAFQLRVAQDVGLKIPTTLITNDPDEARLFVDAHGYRDVVYKAFSATEQDWRETRLLLQEELGLLDHVRYAPVIFQRYVKALYDLRVTVVGRDIFAAAIYSQETEYPVDCRMDIGSARFEAVDLPPVVEKRLLELMERLGIVYGAIDMRRTPEDDYVFLEVNPAGQWLFVEEATKQPIAAAMARLLVEHADPP